jgi:hypothetical protein
VRRFTAILLLIAFAGLGSGALRYLHERAHADDDVCTARSGEPKPAIPHDENNCVTCFQLNLPMLQTGYVVVLACLGIFGILVIPAPPTVHSSRRLIRLDSRGPPPLCSTLSIV